MQVCEQRQHLAQPQPLHRALALWLAQRLALRLCQRQPQLQRPSIGLLSQLAEAEAEQLQRQGGPLALGGRASGGASGIVTGGRCWPSVAEAAAIAPQGRGARGEGRVSKLPLLQDCDTHTLLSGRGCLAAKETDAPPQNCCWN